MLDVLSPHVLWPLIFLQKGEEDEWFFFGGGKNPKNRFEYRKPCDKLWDKFISTEAYINIRHKMRIAWLEHRTTKYNSQMVTSLGRGSPAHTDLTSLRTHVFIAFLTFPTHQRAQLWLVYTQRGGVGWGTVQIRFMLQVHVHLHA